MSHCHCLAENLVKPTERSVYTMLRAVFYRRQVKIGI